MLIFILLLPTEMRNKPLKLTTMTNQDIHTQAAKLTDQEANNILGHWDAVNETTSIDLCNSLVRLGDSKQLSIMTVIAKKYNTKEESEMYYNAYCI